MMSFYWIQSWCRCKQTSPVFLSDLSVKSDRFSFERSACGQVQTDDLDSWCESQNSRRSWRVSHDGPLKEIVHVKNENNVVIYWLISKGVYTYASGQAFGQIWSYRNQNVCYISNGQCQVCNSELFLSHTHTQVFWPTFVVVVSCGDESLSLTANVSRPIMTDSGKTSTAN